MIKIKLFFYYCSQEYLSSYIIIHPSILCSMYVTHFTQNVDSICLICVDVNNPILSCINLRPEDNYYCIINN